MPGLPVAEPPAGAYFPIQLPAHPDTKIDAHPAYPIIYVPKSVWRDTINALVIHADSNDATPVVALAGVRRNGAAWQPYFVARTPGLIGQLQRISVDERGLFVGDQFGAWAWVAYAEAKTGAMRGWIRVEPARAVIMERATLPRDTSRAGLAIAARFRALIPDSLLVRRGACPFECCTYRDWKATHEIPVYRRELDKGTPVFTLRTGEVFHALTGNVHITQLAVVAIGKKTDAGKKALVPGDTVVVLESEGEGFFHVWRKRDGKVLSVQADWSPLPKSVNRQLGNQVTEWWAHARTLDGREGWFRADSARFDNADRCS